MLIRFFDRSSGSDATIRLQRDDELFDHLPGLTSGSTGSAGRALRTLGPMASCDRLRPAQHPVVAPLAAAVAGYLLGSIPSADIATRLARTDVTDMRTVGSGNPGATNAAAVLGTRWGAAVLAADVAKGAAAGALGRAVGGPAGAYAAATASIAGHIVPPWSNGRGGKGVATSAGACIAVFPAYFPVDAGVTAVAAVSNRNAERTVRMSSVAWVAAALLWWRRGLPNAWGPPPTVGLPLFSLAGAGMIVAKFRSARRR